jgi:hypothetical protein
MSINKVTAGDNVPHELASGDIPRKTGDRPQVEDSAAGRRT